MATSQLFFRLRYRRCPSLLPPTTPRTIAPFFRSNSTSSNSEAQAPDPPRRRRLPPPRPHKFSEPSDFVGSWNPTDDPREAKIRLGRLHRDYQKHMKQIRAEYAYEMELLGIEKQKKDEARRDALRLANEERNKVKAAAAEIRAAESKAFQEELRQTLLKERQQKLESWRGKEKLLTEKRADKNELLRRQSSEWVSEDKLEDRIMAAIIGTTIL
ncbi:uncharacterized protein LOC121996364 [Zingiber officinale]|uniref:uncharacterized protein LOC121996364 n=1 Tax=Zingiber officinale TaxID=94328 RepID=UPI001C4D2175|nr:uncharacterized protein LOC121996364 [Zingiber officinale]